MTTFTQSKSRRRTLRQAAGESRTAATCSSRVISRAGLLDVLDRDGTLLG